MYDPVSKTLFIGKKILYLPTCHSTNDIAAEIVRSQPFSEGLVIITDNQTAGRGQRGNQWVTTQGQNFTFSLVLKPTFLTISEQFILSQTVALGIRAYLHQYVTEAKVKWPNDLYINERKAGGILIENALQGSKIAHSIVGVGLNINQIEFMASRATSLGRETGRYFSLLEELPLLLQWLETYYLRLRSGHIKEMHREYLQHLLGYRKERAFRENDQIIRGVVAGISHAGKLQLEQPGQPLREYDIKEIEWIWED